MHDRWWPSPRETVTTVPVDETSGIHILYSTLKDVGYNLSFKKRENDPNALSVTADPVTARKLERIRDDINREGGDLQKPVNVLLEPWDGLIEDISTALDFPTSVPRVLSEAHKATKRTQQEAQQEPAAEEAPQQYNHLAELFVLAYEKGRFGDPKSKAKYKKIPFHSIKARAISSRLRTVYKGFKEAGIEPISLEETKDLLGSVIRDYLGPRPYLRPISRQEPTEVPAQA